MAQHVLVTGGAGFIGSHLTRRLLARGERVTILDDFNDFYDPARKRENLAETRATISGGAGSEESAVAEGAGSAERSQRGPRPDGAGEPLSPLQVVEGDIRDAPLVDRLFAEGRFDAVV